MLDVEIVLILSLWVLLINSRRLADLLIRARLKLDLQVPIVMLVVGLASWQIAMQVVLLGWGHPQSLFRLVLLRLEIASLRRVGSTAADPRSTQGFDRGPLGTFLGVVIGIRLQAVVPWVAPVHHMMVSGADPHWLPR